MTDFDAYADQILPLDGPYNASDVHTAARLVAELVRRLNHATLGDNAEQSLPIPQDVDQVVVWLHTALSRVPQLFNQIASRVQRLEGVGVDDHHDGLDSSDAAVMVAQHLARAVPHIDQATTELRQAQRITGRLYVRSEAAS